MKLRARLLAIATTTVVAFGSTTLALAPAAFADDNPPVGDSEQVETNQGETIQGETDQGETDGLDSGSEVTPSPEQKAVPTPSKESATTSEDPSSDSADEGVADEDVADAAAQSRALPFGPITNLDAPVWTDNCGVDNNGSFTVTEHPNATWEIVDNSAVDGTVTATATANQYYWFYTSSYPYLPTKTKSFTETQDNSRCAATPVIAEFGQPTCEVRDDHPNIPLDGGWVTIPETEGVDYFVNGGPAVAGATYPLNAGGTNILTAEAQEGFELTDGEFSQEIVIEEAPNCLEPATPVIAEFGQPTCDVRDDHADIPLDEGWVTIPETEGVDYFLNTGALSAGTYRLNAGGTNILTAEAQEGFELTDGEFSQEIVIEEAPDCSEQIPTPATPEDGASDDGAAKPAKPVSHPGSATNVTTHGDLVNTGATNAGLLYAGGLMAAAGILAMALRRRKNS